MFWLSYECLSILCDTFFASKKGHFQQLWLYIAVSIDDLSYTGYGIRQYNDIAHGDYFRLQKKKNKKENCLSLKREAGYIAVNQALPIKQAKKASTWLMKTELYIWNNTIPIIYSQRMNKNSIKTG